MSLKGVASAVAAATEVTAASALTANVVPAGDGSRGLADTIITALAALGNGQALSVLALTELTTIAAAATTDTTIQIPANAIAIGVSVRVTTVIPTATAFDYGIAGATTRYGTAIAAAATTTNPGTNDALRYYAAATKIRFTPDIQPAANTGRVRVTIYYITITPPTS